jgi:hypothetical protein
VAQLPSIKAATFWKFSVMGYYGLIPQKASSPYKALQRFLFQIPVFSLSLKLSQYMLKYSPSSSRLFHLFVNIAFQKVLPMEDMTNSGSFPSFDCRYDIPFLLDST